MNYHHSYHAGNFADVFKHFALSLILEKLQEKENGFFVLDTHAGIGKYSLENNKEFAGGIAKIYNKKVDKIFASYLGLVKRFNFHKDLKNYPGSPKIIKNFLRSQDRAIFCELHQKDHILLRKAFAGDKSVQIFNQDGYQFLKSHLPPKENRGLILIDPPFEKENGKEDDFISLLKFLPEALKRFSHGTYLIWYPITDELKVKDFYQKLQIVREKFKEKEFCIMEIEVDTSLAFVGSAFSKCGLLIVNPPWQFCEKMSKALPMLLEHLGQDSGKFRIDSLAA